MNFNSLPGISRGLPAGLKKFSGYEPEGRRFDSSRVAQRKTHNYLAKSKPCRSRATQVLRRAAVWGCVFLATHSSLRHRGQRNSFDPYAPTCCPDAPLPGTVAETRSDRADENVGLLVPPDARSTPVLRTASRVGTVRVVREREHCPSAGAETVRRERGGNQDQQGDDSARSDNKLKTTSAKSLRRL
jgi:hypothetical protein